MAGARFISLLLMATLSMGVLAACGGEQLTPHGEEPRRVVDPRSEALRFFPVDTEAVALVRVVDAESMRHLDEAISSLATWSEQRDRLAQALRVGGVDPEQILTLARTPGTELEIPEPEIAIGAVPGTGPSEQRMLYVLATDQGPALEDIFEDAAKGAALEAAGDFDGAHLYRVRDLDLAFAIRDGVIVAAVGMERLQQAIARRDGNRESQLDEATVNELLNRLPQVGSLSAYVIATDRLAGLLDLLLGPLETEAGEPIEPIDLGLVADAENARLAIDAIVSLSAGPAEGEDAPSATAEDPKVTAVTATDLTDAIGPGPPLPIVSELARLEPLAAASWIEGDRARIRIETGRD